MESGVVDLTAMAFGMILGARSIPRCGTRWDFQYDFAYESVILKGKLMMNSWMENGVHDFQKGVLIFWAPALLRRLQNRPKYILSYWSFFCQYPYFFGSIQAPIYPNSYCIQLEIAWQSVSSTNLGWCVVLCWVPVEIINP